MGLRDSQRDLADSIARSVQAGLPTSHIREEIHRAVRRALQAEGLIRLEGRRVEIISPRGLAELAGE